MKKKRFFLILIAMFLFVGGLACASGCSRKTEATVVPTPEEIPLLYWDGEDAEYVSVKTNCSSYGRWNDDWQDWSWAEFFLNRDKTVAPMMTDGSNHTQTMKIPAGTENLYVIPPEIALIDEMDEQLIPLDQQFPIQMANFNVVSVSIPRLSSWNPFHNGNYSENSVVVDVYLISESNQYPAFLSLRYDGKSYGFTRTEWEGDEKQSIKYMCYHCEMPDLYSAAMAIKYGTLRYSKLLTIITAKDAVYECDNKNITVHVLSE